MRYVDDQVFEALARLNEELAERGDPARVRYAAVQYDPYLPDEWLVTATFELPDPPAGRDAWPLERIYEYNALTREWLKELVVLVHCQYRTHDELAADPQPGRPVPELV